MRRHDSHVRARASIIRRVVSRWVDWGTGNPPWEEMEAAAARGLADFRWDVNWHDKMSPYAPFGPRQAVVGRFKDVPAFVIHMIMCKAMFHLPKSRRRRA